MDTLIKKINQIEIERYNRCSHPTSDRFICLNLSYELWQVKIQLKNFKK